MLSGPFRLPVHAADPANRLSFRVHSHPFLNKLRDKETAMSHHSPRVSRRRFLTTAAQAAGLVALPAFIPGKVLGKNGVPPPSEKIIVGGIGIGNRGSYDLGCFLEQPDVRFVAVCDVKAKRREAVKKTVDGSTATRSAPPTATSANCWPARISTPC